MDESPDYKTLWQKVRRKQEEVERRQEQAERRREQAEKESERTIFTEYIRNCHIYFSEPLQIGTNTARFMKGSLTNPAGRVCPTYLRPWSDFHELQTQAYQAVLQLLQPTTGSPLRLFSPRIASQEIGPSVCRRRLASEADLESYERSAVEDHVGRILTALQSNSDARDTFPLNHEIWFYNHFNTIEDSAGSQSADVEDQVCVHRGDASDDANTLLFIIGRKPAAKLPAEYLRAGLRPMNLWKDVVQRQTIPIDRDEKLRYNADRLTGSALTQVYSYMIHEGLSYSCLTTGSCQVFLHVAQDEPETLQYFLAEPNLDVRATGEDLRDGTWIQTPITAVGRTLSLCLMSLHATIRSHHWRNETIPRLHMWEVDFESILQEIPKDEAQSTPPGSEYIPFSPPISSRPQERRSRSGHQYKCAGRAVPLESLDYCTQRCLLGLQSQGQLDQDCPNFVRHRMSPPSDRHQIDLVDLAQLLKQQLDADLDHYCIPCGSPGIRGAPFKLSLMPYGYTFIGKGTTDYGWEDVQREAEVYQVLQPVQGSAVPIFLGTVDLNKICFVHGGARIKHFLLLSWSGKQANLVKDEQDLSDEIDRTNREIRHLGIDHGDLHWSNVLWNSQLGRVQLIDFHKSKLLHPKPRPKRKRAITSDTSPRKRVPHDIK